MTDFENLQVTAIYQAGIDGYDPELAKMSDDQLVTARDALAPALARFNEQTGARVSRAEVADALITMSEMLTAPVPGPKGIDLFMLAVEDISAIAWPLAHRYVARHHRFMRLPLPADYLAAAAPYEAIINGTRAALETYLSAATTAINRRAARRRATGN